MFFHLFLYPCIQSYFLTKPFMKLKFKLKNLFPADCLGPLAFYYPLLSLLLLVGACETRQSGTSEQVTTAAESGPLPGAQAAEKRAPVVSVPEPKLEAAPALKQDKKPAPTPIKTAVAEERAADTASAAKPDPYGWPVKGPETLPGSILPNQRIIAYYGNPLSKRMGILGELPHEEMLARLDEEVAAWQKADPATPVKPALHMVAITAQGSPGNAGKYRLRMTDRTIEQVLEWAEKRDAIVFLDIQVGQSTLQEEIPSLAKFLHLPNVHLGIDPEFSMKEGHVPGRKIGSYNADDINYASSYLAGLVSEHQLPPKVLIVHRFTQGMVKNAKDIELDPRVQIVMHMDGWGSPVLKKDTYRQYIYKEPVQYTGFKIFYKNDTKKGNRLITPEELLKLKPAPLYIQYQ